MSSALTSNSQQYHRVSGVSDFYYYELIEIEVVVNDYHSIESSSSLDTYGYLYQTKFDPNSPSLNLIGSNDDDGRNKQFQIKAKLYSNLKYFLLLTTYLPYDFGEYTIIVYGHSHVNLQKVFPAFLSTTTTTTTTTTRPTTTTSKKIVINNMIDFVIHELNEE